MTKIRYHLPLILLTACAILSYFLISQWQFTDQQWAAPLDDAWIHFQYARNLANGNGFSYNAGEPTAGSTAPLWTLLLAVPALFTENLMPWGLLLSAAFWLASVLLTFAIMRQWAFDQTSALLAALGVMFVGRMNWAAWSGMEATAFAALSLLAIWAYTRYGMRVWVALLFGLASQLRPEGHALFAFAGLLFCYEDWRDGVSFGRIFQTGFLAVLAYTLVALPYALFSLSATGKPLPNTFYAKSGGDSLFSWRTLSETLTLHWRDNPVALLLIPFGMPTLWRRSKLALLWLIGLPIFTAVIVEQTWHHGRYTLPLIPLQIMTAVMGLVVLVAWFGRKTTPSKPIFVLLSVLMLASGLQGLPKWATMLGTNSREILEIDVALGEWLRDNTPPDALIAVDDIGATAYISQRRIFDLNGLISPEMWPIVAIPRGLARNQAETRLLSQVQPDYLAIFPLWHHELTLANDVSTPVHQVSTATRTMIFQQDALVYAFNAPYVREPSPATRLDVTFGDAIKLLGFDGELGAGRLNLYWQSQQSVSQAYAVFIHVTDVEGNIVAQADGPPVQHLAPTDLWQSGDVVFDQRQIMLPADLPAGNYTVTAGFYLPDTFARLPASGADAQVDSVVLGAFER